jgi:hypothetical protein
VSSKSFDATRTDSCSRFGSQQRDIEAANCAAPNGRVLPDHFKGEPYLPDGTRFAATSIDISGWNLLGRPFAPAHQLAIDIFGFGKVSDACEQVGSLEFAFNKAAEGLMNLLAPMREKPTSPFGCWIIQWDEQ